VGTFYSIDEEDSDEGTAAKAKPKRAGPSAWSRKLDEVETRGVKATLPHGKSKVPIRKYHRCYGHMGHDEDCAICRMVKGSARRIYLKVSPFKEKRVAHTFVMDSITWSHRSRQGNKYQIGLKDIGSDCVYFLFLYLRSDSPQQLEDWVLKWRAHPMFQDLGYEFCQYFITDEPGEWGLKSKGRAPLLGPSLGADSR